MLQKRKKVENPLNFYIFLNFFTARSIRAISYGTKKGTRFLVRPFIKINYSLSSDVDFSGSAFFLFEEMLTPIAATEAMRAVIETIIVREPSPKMEP